MASIISFWGARYAFWDGSAWQIEEVASGESTSLALDADDRPHISHYDSDPNYDLKYGFHDGAAWQIETVDGTGYVGKYTSVALDGDGYAHISYVDMPYEDRKHAVWDGAT